MSRSRRCVRGLMGAVSCIVGLMFLLASGAGAQPKADPKTLEGKPAPQLNLTTLDGKKFRLAELRGTVVVLDFWATWCPPCRESLPHLQRLSEDRERFKKGLRILAINAGEQQPVVQKYVSENKLTMPIPMDPGRTARNAYRVSALPTTFIVGRDGRVSGVVVGFGPSTGDEMTDLIDRALEEKAPPRGGYGR